MQRLIPEESLSRVSSFDWLGSIVLSPLGYVLVGPLAMASSPRTVLLGAGMIATLTTVAVLADPAVRNLRFAPTSE